MILWILVGLSVGYALLFFRIERRLASAAKQRRRMILGVLIAAGLPVDALILGELYARFLYSTTDTHRLLPETQRWLARHVDKNSDGFRDVPWGDNPKGDDVYRIGILGSSVTVGQGIDDPGDRFTNVLQRMLRSRPDSLVYEVYNISELDWSTNDHVDAMREIAPRLELDEVILAYQLDQIGDIVFVDEAHGQIVTEYEAGESWLARESALLGVLQRRSLVDRGTRVLYTALRQAYGQDRHWEFQTARLHRIAGDEDVRVRVAVLPMFAEGWEFYSFRAAHERLRETFQAAGMAALDLLPVFEASGAPVTAFWVSNRDTHPNERGHELIAQTMYDAWYPDQFTHEEN